MWYLVVFAVIVLALGLFVGSRLRSDLVRALDTTLATRAEQALKGIPSNNLEDPSDLALPGIALGDTITQIVEPSGGVAQAGGAYAPDTPMVDPDHVRDTRSGTLRGTVKIDAREPLEPYRFLAVSSRDGRVVVVAAPLEDIENAARRLWLLLAIGIGLSLAIAGPGGYWLASVALRPIDRMTVTAAEINAQNLSLRLPRSGTNDEVGRLAETMNHLLARLEQAIEEQRRFTADASHELRTPLAILQAELDVALRSGGDPQHLAMLTSVREEVGQMSRLVDDLLTLARADQGASQLTLASLDLAELVGEVADRFTAQAVAAGIEIVVEMPEIAMVADSIRLRQLLLNLVANALAYTPRGGVVTLSGRVEERTAVLEVTDTGIGIPPEALEHIFDRFFRVDHARSRAVDGSGLGLAICRWAVAAHGGTIAASSTEGRGSRFTVRLPLG